MELGNFLLADESKSVKITGIEVGDWIVHSQWGQPYRVWQCHAVNKDRDGSVGTVDTLAPAARTTMVRGRLLSAFSCFKLDPGYTQEQLLTLQARASKEYDAWHATQRSVEATGRPNIGSMDHLKVSK